MSEHLLTRYYMSTSSKINGQTAVHQCAKRSDLGVKVCRSDLAAGTPISGVGVARPTRECGSRTSNGAVVEMTLSESGSCLHGFGRVTSGKVPSLCLHDQYYRDMTEITHD